MDFTEIAAKELRQFVRKFEVYIMVRKCDHRLLVELSDCCSINPVAETTFAVSNLGRDAFGQIAHFSQFANVRGSVLEVQLKLIDASEYMPILYCVARREASMLLSTHAWC